MASILDLVRTSVAGELIHFVSGGRLLQYPDQHADFVVPVRFGLDSENSTIKDVVLNDSDLEKRTTNDDPNTKRNSFGNDDVTLATPDRYIVDWYGPSDPENPQNWARWKRFFVIFEICFLTVAVYIGSAIYTPGIHQIVEEFQVSEVVALIPLTVYVVGYGIGPMVFAPLSESPWIGRNLIYIPSLILFVILQVPTALSRNIGGFITVRAITGFMSSPPLANGGASMGDVLSPANLAIGLSFWSIFAVQGPVFGPFLGGVFSQVKNWRWSFWILMWVSSIALAFLFFLLPETSPATILQRRARRLRIRTGDSRYVSKAEEEYINFSISAFLYECAARPIIITFTEPGVFFLNWYTALIYAVMYCWFEAFPIVFVGVHRFNLIELGLSYFGISVGVLLACVAFITTIRSWLIPRLVRGEPPEIIFKIAFFAAPILPIAILFFGWSSTGTVHWIVPVIASGLFIIGGFTVFQVVFNYLGMSYPRYLASVFAGNDLFRSCFAAPFPLFANAMFTHLGPSKFPVGWGSTILACFAALMVLIPIFLIRLGSKLRSRSIYAN
ncbi:major facilitator superfamily domain-containing protein [Lipomyces japonicus]|uniref:major facilitator superfamily domain-containing protein n=1 Tax=Lipomyces japonicus TaxID=56871 RepID=UPI0034CF014F